MLVLYAAFNMYYIGCMLTISQHIHCYFQLLLKLCLSICEIDAYPDIVCSLMRH